jgi:GT2 family glycosyltransferase/glycosyltransferase involved in cell wall biosynthesis
VFVPEPDVTVIIVTFNSERVIAGCLNSIGAASEGVTYRLLLVDNNSGDATLATAMRHDREVEVIQTGRNGGYAAAINAALEKVPDDRDVLVMNPDTRLQPGAMHALLDGLRRSNAGIAVPKLVDRSGIVLPSLRRDPSVLRAFGEFALGGHRAGRYPVLGEVVTDEERYDLPGWADWATGAVFMISAACRTAVGTWDESFFLYSEETDYCQRARCAGFGVRYVPSAGAVHFEGGAASPQLRRVLIASKLSLFRRSHSPTQAVLYRLAIIANELSRAVRGSALHRAGLHAAITPSRRATSSPSAAASSSHPADSAKQGFVFFSAQDYWYHNRAHSDIQLARGLAADQPMLLVNSIGMRVPMPGKSTQVARRILRKISSLAHFVQRPEAATPNLVVMSPLILPFYGSRVLRALNAVLVRQQVKMACRAMGIRCPHAIVTIPTAWNVVAGMKLSSLIVNRSDKYSTFAESNMAAIAAMEGQLLAQADAALYVSHTLMAEESPLVRRGTQVFLGHGVDYDRFASVAGDDVPPDIAGIPAPRVGFFGGIDDYVIDFELLQRLARELPEANIVLIGAATCDMSSLTKYDNVYWLGAREYSDIPSYGAAFDVAIMPWLQNEWIQNCNPIKTKEYLALGLPVVSSFYPESTYVADVIAVASNHDEFLSMVRTALAGNGVSTPQLRRARVEDDSWQRRSAVIVDLADAAAR